MVVTKLIEELSDCRDISKPVYASFTGSLNEKYFVSIFGNSKGFPTISLSEDEPLPANKKGDTLLCELKRWREDSIHYHPDSDVYLITDYEYEDGSYDFRYFKLRSISDEGNDLILIAEPDECIELRQHYEAFDESMLADD